MDLLARRDRSRTELQRALARRGYAPADVEAALQRLVESKSLDDRGFAERFARKRMAHAGVGRHYVRQSLRQRGVPKDDTEAGIGSALEQVSEAQSIDRLARLYWSRRSKDEPRVRLKRLWGFLLRRGFPGGLVAERLRVLWPRWQDALDGLDPEDGLEAETE